MFAAVARFLANVAGPTGTLLVLDDLQWAGPDALDLLASVLRQSSDRPLRVIGAYRSTEVRAGEALEATVLDLAREGLAARCDLRPLPFDEAAALLDDQLDRLTGETDALREKLLRQAGGVPFFLISLAQGLASGNRDASDASADRDGDADGYIPADVAASVLQRLALLPAAAQELLGVAAVLGRTMRGDLLAAASDLPEGERITSLEAICQAHLLLEEGEDAYRFAHDLIREAVEAKLSAARRRMLHRRVAEAFEQLPGTPPVERLAYHYRRSDRLDRALTYGLLAAEQAEARRALAEAEEYYRRTIALARKLGDHPREATALERLGLLLDVTAHMAQAREALEQSVQAYRAAGDQEGRRRSLARLTRVYYESGMPPSVGLALLEPFLPSLLDGGVSAGRAMLRIGLARLYEGAARFTDELVEAERAKECAHALGNAALEAEAERWRSHALADLGRPEESVRAAEASLPLAVTGGDLWIECFVLADITWAHMRMGAMWRCQEATDRAVELALRMGTPGPLTYTLCQRGDVAFHLGDWRRARDDIERALALVRPLGTYWIADTPRVLLGRLCLAEGQGEAGRRYVEEGVALAEGMGESTPNMGAVAALGRAAVAETDLLAGRADRVVADLEPLLAGLAGAARGPVAMLPYLAWAYLDASGPERAVEILDYGLAHAQSRVDRLTHMEVLLVWARIAIRRKRWEAAQSTLESAIALGRAMRSPYAEAKALYIYGLLHQAKGEPERARERYEAALSICAQLGEGLYCPKIERALGLGDGQVV
jgi:tetratricopeptide (TPR) repeat protein